MSENTSNRNDPADDPSPFESLIAASGHTSPDVAFATAFRGYDRDEVDAAIAGLTARVRAESLQVAQLTDREHRAGVQNRKAEAWMRAEVETAQRDAREKVERLEAELAAAQAKATDAENRLRGLGEELADAPEGAPSRHKFEEVLRVAEEQAGVLLRNATDQGDRLLTAAREEIENRRKEAQADAEAIRLAGASSDAQQARLRIDTELTAHEARSSASARTPPRRWPRPSRRPRRSAPRRRRAPPRCVAWSRARRRRTRADAEDAVREMRARALEFEESLTRRQDDAQQEFLVLHNQAVAHAERITQDANEQVAASLEHAQRISAKAEDLRAPHCGPRRADRGRRERARARTARPRAGQGSADHRPGHDALALGVLRDAEDRTRQLRWQQHAALRASWPT